MCIRDRLLPLVMAEIVDTAIPAGDETYIFQLGAVMLVLAGVAMLCGVLAAKYSAFASQGFGANLRQCLFDKVQEFSFADIDRFSSASLITRTVSYTHLDVYKRQVTVNVVAPGFITTDMTDALPEGAREALLSTIPMKRLGAAEDVARAVAFFAGEGAGYVTGQVLCVDGGMAV